VTVQPAPETTPGVPAVPQHLAGGGLLSAIESDTGWPQCWQASHKPILSVVTCILVW
jgi:hypothetical protein